MPQPVLESSAVVSPGLDEHLEIGVFRQAFRHPRPVRGRVFADAVPPELHGGGVSIGSQELDKALDTVSDAVNFRVWVEKQARGFVPQVEVKHHRGEEWGNLAHKFFVRRIEAGMIEECVVGVFYLVVRSLEPIEGKPDLVALLRGDQLLTDEGRDSSGWDGAFLEQGYKVEVSRPLHQRLVELSEGQWHGIEASKQVKPTAIMTSSSFGSGRRCRWRACAKS